MFYRVSNGGTSSTLEMIQGYLGGAIKMSLDFNNPSYKHITIPTGTTTTIGWNYIESVSIPVSSPYNLTVKVKKEADYYLGYNGNYTVQHLTSGQSVTLSVNADRFLAIVY